MKLSRIPIAPKLAAAGAVAAVAVAGVLAIWLAAGTAPSIPQTGQRVADADSPPAIAAELDALRSRLVALGQSVGDRQVERQRLGEELASLEGRAVELEASLAEERGRLARLLAGLVRIARIPPAAMMARSDSPVDTVRASILLEAAVPEVNSRAVGLRRALDELAALRSEILVKQGKLDDVAEALSVDADALAAAIAEREANLAIPEEELAVARGAADRAAAAGSVDGLVGQLAEPVAAIPAPELPQSMPVMPVKGELAIDWGQPDAFGDPNQGMTFRVPSGAPVLAPVSGRVRFAGPFRGYGLILILEHGGGYHSMLAGLGRIDVVVGQSVVAGEPVGAAPDVAPSTEAGEVAAVEDGPGDTVYFEFRHNSRPMNPAMGLAAIQERGQG